jgi:hypothetical protein
MRAHSGSAVKAASGEGDRLLIYDRPMPATDPCEEPDHERPLRQARLALFAAGADRRPEPWQVVERFAEASRAVAELRHCGLPLDGWLSEQIRTPGMRQNAAVIAAMEQPEYRERVAHEYIERHPDRAELVRALVELLAQRDSVAVLTDQPVLQ